MMAPGAGVDTDAVSLAGWLARQMNQLGWRDVAMSGCICRYLCTKYPSRSWKGGLRGEEIWQNVIDGHDSGWQLRSLGAFVYVGLVFFHFDDQAGLFYLNMMTLSSQR